MKNLRLLLKPGASLVGGAAIVALSLFGSACGSTNSGEAAATSATTSGSVVKVVGMDTMRFEPTKLTAKAGEPLTIQFTNQGVIPHDLITQGGDKNATIANVASGQTRSGIFLASKPGTYTFYCAQPGHKEAGMVGTIVVQ